MKVGVADYGMSVWEGGRFDTRDRLIRLKEIGYEGTERLEGVSEADAIYKAAEFRALGMDFATVRAPNAEMSIRWTAGLGKDYVWTDVRAKDLETFCRQVNVQARSCAAWGIRVGLHNHLGTPVESHEELDEFMASCPEAGLILDTAHLAAAGGDPIKAVRDYGDRLVIIHLKDWLAYEGKQDEESWFQRGRFCELGAGNIGLDNAAVIEALREVGYDGWLFVEQDTHLQDSYADLSISRDYLRSAGV